jgi:MoaA/NifB/PqqE/SkfB family radical SAM enzyme
MKKWSDLIIPNTSDIKISWNGATKETAETVMLGVNFYKVTENITELVRYRDQHFNKTGYYCRISFQLTFMQNNMHELSDIVKLAAKLGIDRVKGHHLWAHFKEIEGLSMKASAYNVQQWNKYIQDAYRAQEMYRKSNGEKVILENIIALEENEIKEVPDEYECPFLGKELWISATGKISPCCAPDNLRKSLGEFGNIGTMTIREVLKSPAYNELSNTYKSKTLCKTCNMRKPIPQ